MVFVGRNIYQTTVSAPPFQKITEDDWVLDRSTDNLTRNNPEEKVDVMLFGYARGGSTYVGQLIGFHEDAFYFYEPLWNAQDALHYFNKTHICEMNSMSCR